MKKSYEHLKKNKQRLLGMDRPLIRRGFQQGMALSAAGFGIGAIFDIFVRTPSGV